MKNLGKCFITDESGSTAIEYALVAAGIVANVVIRPVLFNSAAAKNLWIAECPRVRPRRDPCR